MIGIHSYICLSGGHFTDHQECLIKENWQELEVFFESKQSKIFASKHISYPIICFNIGDYAVVLEGAIFNFSQEHIINELTKIVAGGIKDIDVDRFVQSSDGDYIVLIKNTKTEECYIFNDILGNIPINYYYDNSVFVISRSLSYIATGISKCQVNKLNLAEFITLDFNLKNHTIFDGIYQTMPAQEIKCRIIDEHIVFEIRSTYNHSFNTENPYRNKKEAAKDLADKFIKGCQDRVRFAELNGYEIVNTMSGGFDSRTVLGGIEKFKSDYSNITYQYTQDESGTVKSLLSKIGSKSNYIKFSFENKASFNDERLTFNTDGKINCFTNSVCYNDLIYGYDHYLKHKKVMYFGGFGGEFIRHPYFSSAWNSNNIKLRFFSPTLSEACDLLGIVDREQRRTVLNVFKTIKEPTSESFCRSLYSEYYTKLVRGAGEDRMRLFYFTSQPLMTKDFVLAARTRMPLHWAGFSFYKLFLSFIDARLNEVEIWGNRPNIHSSISLLLNDYRMKGFVINNIKFALLKKMRAGTPAYDKVELESLFGCIPEIDRIINTNYILKNFNKLGRNFQLKILTFLQYIKIINISREK